MKLIFFPIWFKLKWRKCREKNQPFQIYTSTSEIACLLWIFSCDMTSNFLYIVSHTAHFFRVCVCVISLLQHESMNCVVNVHSHTQKERMKKREMKTFVIPTDCDNYDNETVEKKTIPSANEANLMKNRVSCMCDFAFG